MNMHVPSLQRSLADVVAEYDQKRAGIAAALLSFGQAGDDLKMSASVGGTYGREQINTGNVWETTLESNLLKSAWHHVYDGLNIARISSPNDKRLFEQAMAAPPPFTLDNIRARERDQHQHDDTDDSQPGGSPCLNHANHVLSMSTSACGCEPPASLRGFRRSKPLLPSA